MLVHMSSLLRSNCGESLKIQCFSFWRKIYIRQILVYSRETWIIYRDADCWQWTNEYMKCESRNWRNSNGNSGLVGTDDISNRICIQFVTCCWRYTARTRCLVLCIRFLLFIEKVNKTTKKNGWKIHGISTGTFSTICYDHMQLHRNNSSFRHKKRRFRLNYFVFLLFSFPGKTSCSISSV